ncbi:MULTISPECIES: helix-turn-helix domain-containing protein [unclassified Dietzia]|uniref:helix-turn-helix domain-containing protein n=1 Tax=unclassified Dietzia TaxID=2617939 RepID=UPI000D2102CB|nr:MULTISPECIES: helix-turn-helix domain-containing protein [unclassified Dietzia]AVZ40803.1 hypothetical protein CT688_16355 [Dietzia sp. JS16-p6b]
MRTVSEWSFLTSHARVLMCIARVDHLRVHEIADRVGIPEPEVRRIVGDLEGAGYLTLDPGVPSGRYRLDERVASRVPTGRDAAVLDVYPRATRPPGPGPTLAPVTRLDSRRSATTSAWAVLLVSDTRHLAAAVRGANSYMAHLRRVLPPASPHDTALVGVWVFAGDDGRSRMVMGEASLAARSSVSMSGLWTLVWIDVPRPQRDAGTDHARRVALTSVASRHPHAPFPATFYACFAADHPPTLITSELRRLGAICPQVETGRWFVSDEHGFRGPVIEPGPAGDEREPAHPGGVAHGTPLHRVPPPP